MRLKSYFLNLNFKFKYLEPLFVFCIIFLFYCLKLKFVDSPKLSLLFDSQGYIWIAAACQKFILEGGILNSLLFFLHGCPEAGRQEILHKFPSLIDLVKSGPILPLLLAKVYILFGKSISLSNWSLAAHLMIFIQASTVLFIWIWLKSLGYRFAAYIGTLFALFYAGFGVNAERILSEIPAIALSSGAVLSVCLLFKNMPQNYFLPAFCSGVLLGLAMLARPTLLPMPILLIMATFKSYFICSKETAKKALVGLLICILMGITTIFVPWSMCKIMLTGSPSILVERYGAYNLKCGLSLVKDGWDTLPSEYVSHPDRFTESTSDVVKRIILEYKERPLAALYLFFRKTARLVDSPWNDFQISYLGQSWLLQRLCHQIILIFSFLGIYLMIDKGWRKSNFGYVFSGIFSAMFVLYHFVACLFITMSRYFVTAMPILIVFSCYGLFELFRKRNYWLILVICLCPTISLYLQYLTEIGYGRLDLFSINFGIIQISLLATIIFALTLSTALLVPGLMKLKKLVIKISFVFLAFIIISSSFCSTLYNFISAESLVDISNNAKILSSNFVLPSTTSFNRYYLVIDGNYHNCLDNLKLEINGQNIKSNWQPLIIRDSSQREQALYLAAFAYSSDKKITDFRQWFCTEVPAELILQDKENKINFLNSSLGGQGKLFADFIDPFGSPIHSVSLEKFSWSKGFFANDPGEMRLDTWSSHVEKVLPIFDIFSQVTKTQARIYLLAVKDNSKSELLVNDSLSRQTKIQLDNAEITPVISQRFKSYKLPLKFKNFPRDIALRIKVEGLFRSSCSNYSRSVPASICLLEKFSNSKANSFEEFAPLSPEKLIAQKYWQKFYFEDFIVPERVSQNNNSKEIANLQELKLNVSASPWWECLSYGDFKNKSTIQFKDIFIEISPETVLNLNENEHSWYRLKTKYISSP